MTNRTLIAIYAAFCFVVAAAVLIFSGPEDSGPVRSPEYVVCHGRYVEVVGGASFICTDKALILIAPNGRIIRENGK